MGHRVALVERSEVSYAGTGDGRVDILRLVDPSDDHLDEVRAAHLTELRAAMLALE